MDKQEYLTGIGELYSAEVLGEGLANRWMELTTDPIQKYKLALFLQLESEAKVRLRPLLARHGITLVEEERHRAAGAAAAEQSNVSTAGSPSRHHRRREPAADPRLLRNQTFPYPIVVPAAFAPAATIADLNLTYHSSNDALVRREPLVCASATGRKGVDQRRVFHLEREHINSRAL